MKHKRNLLHLLSFLTIIIIGGIYFPPHTAFAASAVQVAAVEYYDDDIVVFNNGNTKIYYALDTDAAKEDWEVIPADSGTFTTIDTSWINDTTENVLMIKGDKVSTKTRAVLKQKPSKLNITINYTKIENLASTDTIGSLLNIMSTEGNGDNPINYSDLEWRKGDNGKWRDTASLTRSLIEKYLVRGTYLYFRIRAVDDCVSVTSGGTAIDLNSNRVNGIDGGIGAYEGLSGVTFGSNYPDGMDGRRFSDPFKLKVTKKADSLAYNTDGEKFTVKIKYGKEYRVTANYSDKKQGVSDWIQITDKSTTEKNLEDILKEVSPLQYDADANAIDFNGTTTAFPDMNIQVRDFATAKSSPSQISEIAIDKQRQLTKDIQVGKVDSSVTQTDNDIYVYYFGNKYILLTIPNATSDNPYEYCVVKDGYSFDLKKVTWYAVTKGTSVKLLLSRAPQNATIYVRQKTIKSDPVTLASTYVKLKLNYPSIPVVTPQTITHIKAYSDAPEIKVQLNESGKVPFETVVKSVKLGSKEIGFKTSIDPSTTDPNISIMTITLSKDDLNALAVCSSRALTITFENGIVDKTSVKLTVQTSMESGQLTLSGDTGTASGTAKVSVVSSLSSGNTWVYVTGSSKVAGTKVNDILASDQGKAFTSGMNITVKDGDIVTVYEIDAKRHIMKVGNLTITQTMIMK